MTDSEPADDEPRNTGGALTVIEPSAPAVAVDHRLVVPAMVADLGEHAALRFLDLVCLPQCCDFIR